MIRRPPRSTLDRSSAASDVYKRQVKGLAKVANFIFAIADGVFLLIAHFADQVANTEPVSYTHLRAHETVLDLVCRLLLENTQNTKAQAITQPKHYREDSPI